MLVAMHMLMLAQVLSSGLSQRKINDAVTSMFAQFVELHIEIFQFRRAMRSGHSTFTSAYHVYFLPLMQATQKTNYVDLIAQKPEEYYIACNAEARIIAQGFQSIPPSTSAHWNKWFSADGAMERDVHFAASFGSTTFTQYQRNYAATQLLRRCRHIVDNWLCTNGQNNENDQDIS